MIYIPNLITLLRIVFVPFIVILLFDQRYVEAFCLFVVAGITDGLDGYIAKRYDCVTSLGTMLDPIADKCLILSSFVMLAYQEILPFWLTVIVVFRDFVIVIGVLFVSLLIGKVDLKPLWISKLNTVLQISLIVVSLFKLAFFQSMLNLDWSFLYYLVAGTSILSGLAYIWQGLKLTTRGEFDNNA